MNFPLNFVKLLQFSYWVASARDLMKPRKCGLPSIALTVKISILNIKSQVSEQCISIKMPA